MQPPSTGPASNAPAGHLDQPKEGFRGRDSLPLFDMTTADDAAPATSPVSFFSMRPHLGGPPSKAAPQSRIDAPVIRPRPRRRPRARTPSSRGPGAPATVVPRAPGALSGDDRTTIVRAPAAVAATSASGEYSGRTRCRAPLAASPGTVRRLTTPFARPAGRARSSHSLDRQRDAHGEGHDGEPDGECHRSREECEGSAHQDRNVRSLARVNR